LQTTDKLTTSIANEKPRAAIDFYDRIEPSMTISAPSEQSEEGTYLELCRSVDSSKVFADNAIDMRPQL
jgi:hypothetical protein